MLSIFHTNVSQEKFAEVSEVTTYNLAPVSIICTVGIRLGYTVYLPENCFSQSKTKILSRENQNGCYMVSCITCLDIQQPVETNL